VYTERRHSNDAHRIPPSLACKHVIGFSQLCWDGKMRDEIKWKLAWSKIYFRFRYFFFFPHLFADNIPPFIKFTTQLLEPTSWICSLLFWGSFSMRRPLENYP
jgi:hypothetical protein